MTRTKKGDVWNEWSSLVPRAGIGLTSSNGTIGLVLGSGIATNVDGAVDVLLGSGLAFSYEGRIVPVLGSGLAVSYNGYQIELNLGTELTNQDGNLGIRLDNSDGMNSSGLEKSYYGLKLKSAATLVGAQHVAPIVMLGSNKTYGIEVTDAIGDTSHPVMSKAVKSAIEEGEKRALRRLYIAAGAEYNDTGADKTKTAPWGEIVTHKIGHYYLNGLGDITEEEMGEIYSAGKVDSTMSVALYRKLSLRTNLVTSLSGGEGRPLSFYYLCNIAKKMQVFNNTSNSITTVNTIHAAFASCISLKYIIPIINVSAVTSATEMNSAFSICSSLILCRILKLKYSLSFSNSPLISKESILYTIQNASPASAITITLHPDAYTRLADDAEIVAALEAKNAELATSGSGSISLVSA